MKKKLLHFLQRVAEVTVKVIVQIILRIVITVVIVILMAAAIMIVLTFGAAAMWTYLANTSIYALKKQVPKADR